MPLSAKLSASVLAEISFMLKFFFNFLLNQINKLDFVSVAPLHRDLYATFLRALGLFKLSETCVLTIKKLDLTVVLTVVDTKAKLITSYMLMCIYTFKDNIALFTSLIMWNGPLKEKRLYKAVITSCVLLEMFTVPERRTVCIKLTLR